MLLFRTRSNFSRPFAERRLVFLDEKAFSCPEECACLSEMPEGFRADVVAGSVEEKRPLGEDAVNFIQNILESFFGLREKERAAIFQLWHLGCSAEYLDKKG